MVSIIIPTYKRLPYLKRAIESILNQTYKNFEIIVVIDGEDKETYTYLMDLAENLGLDKVKTFMYKYKVGANICRNQGFMMSKGSYIALMDDDDEWISTKLEKQIKLLNKEKYDFQLCFTSIVVYKREGIYKVFPRKNWSNNLNISDYLFKRFFFKSQGLIQTSSILVSRKVFEKVKFTPNLPKHQDWDWLLNIEYVLGKKLKIFQVKEPLVIYHTDVPKESRTSKKNMWRFSLEWAKKNKYKFSTQSSFNDFLSSVVITGIAMDEKINFKTKINLFINVIKEKKRISCKDFVYFNGSIIKKIIEKGL